MRLGTVMDQQPSFVEQSDSKQVSLTVERLAAGGDGVGFTAQKACFIPYSAPEDHVRARIVQTNKRFLRGRIEAVISPSPHRRKPPCPLFGVCGGCNWLHLEESEQLRAKEKILSHALGLQSVPMTPSLAVLGYRGRARFHFQTEHSAVHLGFIAEGSNEIVDVPTCPILTPRLNECIPVLRAAISLNTAVAGSIRLADGRTGVGAYISFDGPIKSEIYSALTGLPSSLFCGVTVNVDGLDSVISGDPYVEVEGTDLTPFYYPAASFGQANAGINRAIAEFIRSLLKERQFKQAVELFAGAGNHSLAIAPFVSTLLASELDDGACRRAEINLKQRGFNHVKVVQGDALDVYKRQGGKVDLAVLNPPRTGHLPLTSAMALRKPAAVLYISCNPATLARDIAQLTAAGYRLSAAAGFDMFPQTSHMEAAILLEC